MSNLLKKLELSGFKSFAQKTTFDFSQGITAIVGPNGSGKSNVIDAIRWLLGEREAKNLRGAKVEDLIFAGTAKRPRMGFAQASLYLENKNNFFPVEFAEISVTRQVSRDGVSRYFLNSAEVRLKDLIDFFARARLGARGMVVVTQGNSDVFIQSPPRERREMIEEMLGLREHQLKKVEAERRLKSTQINLEKAKALVDEILPHLRSLKRQTGKWEKREVLQGELRDLENQFFGVEARELEGKIALAKSELINREEDLERLKEVRRLAEENLKRVEANHPEERRELTKAKKDIQSLLEKRSVLQKELGRLEAQLEMTQSSHDSSLPSAGILFEFVKNVKGKLEALQEAEVEYDDLKSALQEIIENIEEMLHGSIAEDKEVIPAGLKSQFTKMSKELQGIQETIAELRTREEALEKNQESFYEGFKSAVTALEHAKDGIEGWEIVNQKLIFEREHLEMRREEWERRVREAGRSPQEFMSAASTEGVAVLHDRDAVQEKLFKLRGELAAIGEVDEALVKEAGETETRYEFLKHELEDLERAGGDLKKLIVELQTKIKTEFGSSLRDINEGFNKFFNLMFGGGQAKLKLEIRNQKIENRIDAQDADSRVVLAAAKEEEESREEGIEIELRLPRKRINSIDMLSGGERSLVGIAALFALVSVSPPPFLVLDEIDAALDERNARRFAEMLKEFSRKTQFVLVTHNRATMEAADMLYGVTMNEDATSKVVSLKLEPQQA